MNSNDRCDENIIIYILVAPDMNQNPDVVIEQHIDDSVDKRIQLASKMSMDDEEELLGILQTKEQLESSLVDDRFSDVLHEICDPVRQEYDSCSMESDVDWKEDVHIHKGILDIALEQSNYDQYIDESNNAKHALADEYSWRYKSNLSPDGTQSSSSWDGQRSEATAEQSLTSHRSRKPPQLQLCDFNNRRSSESFDAQRHDVEQIHIDDGITQKYDSEYRNDGVQPEVNTPLAPRRLHRSSTRDRESDENNTKVFRNSNCREINIYYFCKYHFRYRDAKVNQQLRILTR